MSEEKYTVFIDSREASTAPGRSISDSLVKLGIHVEVENLGNSVDYLIPGLNGVRHAIQRKGANEFTSPRKIFEDIIGMKQLEGDTECFVLLEGSLSFIQKWAKHMPIAPIIGGVESILLDYNVKIIPSPNRQWTSIWLAQRAKRLGKTKVKTPMSVAEKLDRELPLRDQGRRIIETLPDIGPTLAIRIMETYNTAKEALDNVESWSLIDGIATGKMQKIREVLNAQWNESKSLNSSESVEGSVGGG